MSNHDNEITFTQVFAAFKKCFVKIIVFTLIAIFISTAIFAIIKSFTDVKGFSTEISFSSVDSSTQQTLKFNKANVVNAALIDCNKDIELSKKIVKNLSVGEIMLNSDKVEHTLPTTYEIFIKKDNSLGFSTNEYKELLTAIANQYTRLFEMKELVPQMQGYNATSDIKKIEYFEVANKLSDAVSTTNSSLASYISDYNYSLEFRSSTSNKTFNDLLSTFNLLVKDIEALKYYIVKNNAELATGNIKEYLLFSLSLIESKIANYQSVLDVTTEQLKIYKPDFSYDSEGNVIVSTSDSDIVKGIISNINQNANLLATAKENKSNISTYISILDNTTTTATQSMFTYIEEKITEYSNLYAKTLNEYQAMVVEYNKSSFPASFAKISSPTTSNNTPIITNGMIVILDLVVALVVVISIYPNYLTKVRKENMNTHQDNKEVK